MKIIITGSLGHISKPLAQELLSNGHDITVISSDAGKRGDIEALGASAAIGSIEDADFLTATFKGADGVYTMIPPQNYFDPGVDIKSYYRSIGNNYATAITNSGVKRVVHLSSIGAHLDKNSGLILAHYEAETILNKLDDVNITFMRPSAFYYNLFGFLGAIKSTGAIAANYGGSDKVVWVSPVDIASEIADEFSTPLSGKKVRYVASDELSGDEVARILGEAIGKPGMKWLVITDEQMKNALQTAGMPPSVVADFVEMNASMHTGELFGDYYMNRPKKLGTIKLADFAKEFAAVYSQN